MKKSKPSGIKRSQPTGHDKRKMKKKQQAFIKSIAGSMFKYVKKVEKPDENSNREEDKSEHHESVNNSDECHLEETENQSEEHEDISDSSDPGNWGYIDQGLRDLLVKNGHATRLPSGYRFPKDSIKNGHATWRNFSRRLIREHEISHDHVMCMTS